MEGRTPWWCLNGLDVADAGLTLGGQPVAAAAARHGTPLYLYDPQAVRRQAAALKAALSATGLEWRIRYAMKANRFGPILDAIRAEGDVGIDACSPRELELARAHAFATRDISVTASMLAERDLDAFVAAGVHVNLDSLSVLRRYARRVPRGTRCGLRIDPDVQIGYGDDARVAYGRSKFGLLPASVADAASLARQLGLVVDTLHVHCGWGLQSGACSPASPSSPDACRASRRSTSAGAWARAAVRTTSRCRSPAGRRRFAKPSGRSAVAWPASPARCWSTGPACCWCR